MACRLLLATTMPTNLLGILLDLHRRGLRRARLRCVAWWTAGVGLGVALALTLDLLRPPHTTPRRRQARDDAQMLALALEHYRLVHGLCPRDLGALVAASMLRRLRPDPWGQPYEVTCSGGHDPHRVCSRGPDRVPSDDDLCSDDPDEL